MEVQDLLVDDGPHVLRTALRTKPRGHSFKGQRKGSSCRGEAGTGGEDPRTGVQGRKHWPEGRVSRQHGQAGRELSLRSPVLQHPALGRWPHAARSLNVTKPDDMHQGRFGPHPPTAPRRGAPPQKRAPTHTQALLWTVGQEPCRPVGTSSQAQHRLQNMKSLEPKKLRRSNFR